jgi:cytidylate kinase
MGILAMSQTLGSLGEEIGRAVAGALSYEYIDREIVLRAGAEFGEDVAILEHLTEARPTLWERLSESRRRYLAYVESVIWELAARDNVVLVGRGAPFVLQGVPHALRVRVSAPGAIRVRRMESSQGLTPDAAEVVRHSDRERAARIRFLYNVDWDAPIHYDLVLSTERLDVPTATALVLAAFEAPRLTATPEAQAEVRDRSLLARAQAALLANPVTRDIELFLQCSGGHLSVSGRVSRDDQRRATEAIVALLPGAARISCEIAVVPPLFTPTPP